MNLGNLLRSTGKQTTGRVCEQCIAPRREYHYAVLRVKRAWGQHYAEELLAAAMDGDVWLLKKIKTIKRGQSSSNSELPDSVVGAKGEQEIREMFKDSYERLFNSSPSVPGDREIEEMKTVINNLIGASQGRGGKSNSSLSAFLSSVTYILLV